MNLKKENLFKILSSLILIAGILLISLSSIFLVFIVKDYFSGETINHFFKTNIRNIGTLSEIVGIGAICLWISRKAWLKLKKEKYPLADWFRHLFLLLKKHHIFLGITTLLLALAHGMYFLLLDNGHHRFSIYTGIITFAVLVILSLLGLYHKVNIKTKKNIQSKKNHMLFAFIFVILAVIHIYL